MADTPLTREKITAEAMSILTSLRENVRSGKSNKLADVKSAFEDSVSLDFDTYFFFLRKYHFIGLDREACLQLTTEGEKVLDGDRRERFAETVSEYFASRLDDTPAEVVSDSNILEAQAASAPPPPPVESEEAAETTRPLPPLPLSVTAPIERNRVSPVERARARGVRADREEPTTMTPSPVGVKPAAPREIGEHKGGQEIDLRYVKYDAIGQGPLGTVFRGRHTALGLDVAIKELKDIFGYFSFLQRGEVIKRLKREICAQALVRHPSVASILDQNCDVARPYFVVEMCSGGSLRSRFDAAGGKPLPIKDTIRFFLQICYGLRAAHAQGLTHGNLKPENVIIDQFGNAKLSDFGLSRVIEVDSAKGMPQVFVGTGGMAYMSPEQMGRNSKDIGPASDVYSAGMLFYEMCTGQLPGRRSPLPSAVNKDVPAKLDPLFDKMTQDKRADRYPDVDAVLADFYAAFDDGTYLQRGELILSTDIVAPAAAPAQ